MSIDVIIRKATSSDADSIIQFNIAMAKETENKELATEIITAGVNRLLQHPEYGFYLVSQQNNRIVGSLMITMEWSDWRNGLFWWIQSVYVLPGFRRKGIYSKLYNHIKDLAAQQGNVCGFRLYVEKENFIAQKTYRNLGMKETNYKMYDELV